MLIEVFARLDRTGFFAAAQYPESQRAKKSFLKVDVTAARQRRDDGLEWLGDLAVTFEGWVEPGVTLGRPKGVSYHILLDLGAVYQFVTGEPPTRQVRGGDHPERGKDYGPFWDFASAVWHAIFENGTGLSYAMKDFAAGQAQFTSRYVHSADTVLLAAADVVADRTLELMGDVAADDTAVVPLRTGA
jgi:hypothetical protein